LPDYRSQKNQCVFFLSVALAILPWPPSLQTFITIISTFWKRLLQKLEFQLNEKYVI